MASQDVKVRIVREDGQEFILDNTLWMIPSDGLDGWDYVTNTISYEDKAFGDGGILSSERVGIQDRTIKAYMNNKNLLSIIRDSCISFFGVKHTFKVYLTYQGRTRWCEGNLYKFSLPNKNIYKKLELQFTIRCMQPYLLSVDEFGEDIASVIPKFGFPFISRVNKGFIFSHYKFADEVELSNSGDVETYPKIVLLAKGDVKNPIVFKDDKFIKILDTLHKDDVIIIDLTSTPATVKKNGVNIIGKTSRDSSFYDLKFDIGTNTIKFNADEGTNLLGVTIYYNQRYVGI